MNTLCYSFSSFPWLISISSSSPSPSCRPRRSAPQSSERTEPCPLFRHWQNQSLPPPLSLLLSLYFFYKSLTPQSKLFFDFFSSHRRAAKSSPFSEILILTCRYLLKSSGRESPFLRRSLFSDSPSIISSHQFDPMSRKSRTDTEGILLLLRRSLGCVNSCNLIKALSGT